MKLYAISDLHLAYEHNREAISQIVARPDDWLILAGDICETRKELESAFKILGKKFKRLVWVPGNHELWTMPKKDEAAYGQDKYEQMLAICREYDVLTPEDPYPVITFESATVRVAPLFLLYDYSYKPMDVPIENAVSWAMESGIQCMDEHLLHPHPYDNVVAWCHARCSLSKERLETACADGIPTVLINHFPLREDLVWLPRIPRFSIWCGTRLTEDWHVRFNASVVVSGHLHIPSTKYRDKTRFEEVSLGYPNQWSKYRAIDDCVREILPASRFAG